MQNKPLFDTNKFKRLLNTRWLGQSLLYFEELNSTNTCVKKLPADEISHGLLCLTDNQTKGRGQYERSWESQPGMNLTFTLCFTPQKAERLHVLTLATALALVNEIEHEMEAATAIKWPNDVLVNDRKAGGLLTETIFNGNKLDRVLIGIGINVNQQEFEGPLQQSATSLRNEKGASIEREMFLARFLSRAEFEYRRWHTRSTDLLKDINKLIKGHGKWIQLEVNGKVWTDPYKFIGVNEDGRLLVIDEDGEINTFSYEQIRLITN